MEKTRSTKVIAIVALLLAVVGVSLGFAAYNTSLTIGTSADVKPAEENFKIVFLKDPSGTTSVSGVDVEPALKVPTTLLTETATIDGTTISDLKATFTGRGQKVVYEFYVKNIGSYDGYLKSIIFNEIESNIIKKCTTAVTGATKDSEQALVDLDCPNITLTLSVGNDAGTQNVTSSLPVISNRILGQGDYELVTVTIEYTAGAKQNSAEDFTVEFGDINLNYSTSDINS